VRNKEMKDLEKTIKGRKKGGPKALGLEVEEYIKNRAVNCHTKRELLSEQIQDELEEAGYISPTYETMIKKISRARANVDGTLDGKWSFGSCIKHNIPHEYIKDLVQHQNMMLERGDYLTIRRARWLSKLYPVLKGKVSDYMLLQIAAFYSRKEQIAEIDGLSFANTLDLDKEFITNPNISFSSTIVPEFMKVYFPFIRKEEKQKSNIQLEDKIKLIFKELPPAKAALIDEFKNLLLSSKTNKDKQADVEAFLKENPELEPEIQQLLLFSTRDNWIIQDNKKAGK
jgi:hypothetical protein